jgi:hypothetical protein
MVSREDAGLDERHIYGPAHGNGYDLLFWTHLRTFNPLSGTSILHVPKGAGESYQISSYR